MRGTYSKGIALAGVVAVALSLTVAGATGAPGNGKAYGKGAAKQCAQERKSLGKAEFNAKYGKPAMPNCIGVVRNGPPAATPPAGDNPAQTCRTEGVTPGNGNEFGKCVSANAMAQGGKPDGTPGGGPSS